MRNLHNAGLRGRLPFFIESFLKNRQFHVRLGFCYSDLFDQEMGVPQGQYPFTHSVRIKDKFNSQGYIRWCRMLLYVNDFLLCYRSKHIHIIERRLQQCLNKLPDWADTNGFNFFPSKTVCIHFCKLRKPHPEPTLLLNGTPVPVVEEIKFLGVIFVMFY